MLEGLKNLDAQLVLFFNHLNNPILDFLFYWISDKFIWIPFYVLLAWFVYRKEGFYLFLVLIFIAAAITLSDQLASTIIKPAVMRLRPCHDPAIASQIHLVKNYCGGEYGFISSHAANVFALAAFLSGLFKNQFKSLQNFLWIWASVVSFSRIYLGAHFPGDVIGGAITGIIVGIYLAKLYRFFKSRNSKAELY